MKRSCKQFQELIISLRDGDTLSWADREALDRHMAECPDCREFERDIVQVFEGFKEETLPSLDEEFFQEIREDILGELTSKPPVKTSRCVRLLENVLPLPPRWCGVFVPILSGVFGIFLGIIITTTWQQGHQDVQQKITQMQARRIYANASPDVRTSSDIIDVVEDYVIPGDLLDILDDQEIQVLLGELSDELPESVWGNASNGTG
jgi:hypothetical protein